MAPTLSPEHVWSSEDPWAAMVALAKAAYPRLVRPIPAGVELGVPPRDAQGLERWMDGAVEALGLETELLETSYAALDGGLRELGPTLLRLPGDRAGFLLLLKGHGGSLRLLCPDHRIRRVPRGVVHDALCGPLEGHFGARFQNVLDRMALSPAQSRRSLKGMFQETLGGAQIPLGWMLRIPPGGPFMAQLHDGAQLLHLGLMVAGHSLQYLALLAVWWFVGKGILAGYLEPGWTVAAGLCLVCVVLGRVVGIGSQGKLGVGFGAILKRRLLVGALKQDPDQLTGKGFGHLLGRVLESEQVEVAAIHGGLQVAISVLDLAFASLVISQGSGGMLQLGATWGLLLVSGLMILRFHRIRGAWTRARIEMTHILNERMVGHRTVLAQQQPDRRLEGDDARLAAYSALSAKMDRVQKHIGLAPRASFVVALLTLTPAFVQGGLETVRLAVGLFGALLVYQALAKISQGFIMISGGFLAWREVRPLYEAAAVETTRGSPALIHSADGEASARTEVGPMREGSTSEPTQERTGVEPARQRSTAVFEAREVSFRYPSRARLILEKASLRIDSRDRILLEGPSGSGKSTLAAVMTGLRRPDSGLLLVDGLDWFTLGAKEWRRRVGMAPQFHENHVMTGTFAFNLLMGRHWPPGPEDMAKAQQVAVELGLGPLLARMPAGMNQMVGDGGWHLSHGECSRLYMARALLQEPRLLVLDESFAALDPLTLQLTLERAMAAPAALVVIAHP